MPTRSFTVLAVLGCTIAGLAVRMSGEDVSAPEAEPFPGDWLQEHGVALVPAPEGHHALRYSPIEECVQGYRVSIEETMPDRVAQFFNRRPEQSEALLVLSTHEDEASAIDRAGQPVRKGTLVFQSPDAGVRAYTSTEPTPLDLERDFYSSPTAIGPAAPDAACRKRSWDAVEDALALGWPQLSPHRVRTGETWTGARVEGRCNETACLTPDGLAGAGAHDLACVTPSWTETLVGVADAGWHRYAAIVGHWRDREDAEDIEGGVITERRALLNIDNGRLAWSETRVLHRWSQIERRIVIESIDNCPGSLASIGWEPPADLVRRLEQATPS